MLKIKSFMDAFIILFLILLLSIFRVQAQWERVEGGVVWCFASDDNYLYAGHAGGFYIPGDTTPPHCIIRSNDNGVSWVNVSNGLTSRSDYSLSVYTLLVKGTKIFAGTDNGIFVSSNHGDNWTQLDFDPMNGEVHCFLVNGSIIFAGTDAGQWRCNEGGIFCSDDDGITWIPSNVGLQDNCQDKRVYAFAIVDSILFSGSWGGEFISLLMVRIGYIAAIQQTLGL